MFTREASFLRKNTCCANPSRLKKSQGDLSKRSQNDLSENQEYLNQKMIGKTICYLKNTCEPHYFQTTCQISNTPKTKNLQQNLIKCINALLCKQKMSFAAFCFNNSVAGTWAGCFYFHKINCKPVSEKLTTMSFIIALIVVKREAKVFRTIQKLTFIFI